MVKNITKILLVYDPPPLQSIDTSLSGLEHMIKLTLLSLQENKKKTPVIKIIINQLFIVSFL